MIKIFHSKRARSARIIWLLEEVGVPYELEAIAFTPDALQSPDYLKLHPLGQIPVIQEHGMTMFESGAILEYLLEKHDQQNKLAPAPGTPERPEYLQWFHYGEASLARYITDIVRERFGTPQADQVPAIIAKAQARYRSALSVVDRALGEREFICGPTFTAADIMISYGIVMSKVIRELPPDFKHVAAYLERLKTRPAYDRAWS
jgi:glutathione S-transferase